MSADIASLMTALWRTEPKKVGGQVERTVDEPTSAAKAAEDKAFLADLTSTVPPIPVQCTHKWQVVVPAALRQHIMGKILVALCAPMSREDLENEERKQYVKECIGFSRMFEEDIFKRAEARDKYYYMLAEQIYKIQKLRQQKKEELDAEEQTEDVEEEAPDAEDTEAEGIEEQLPSVSSAYSELPAVDSEQNPKEVHHAKVENVPLLDEPIPEEGWREFMTRAKRNDVVLRFVKNTYPVTEPQHLYDPRTHGFIEQVVYLERDAFNEAETGEEYIKSIEERMDCFRENEDERVDEKKAETSEDVDDSHAKDQSLT